MELVLATFTALFTVVNPFGAMPVFITLTQDDTPNNRNQQALRACVYMAIILSVFFLAGQYVLNFFGIGLTDIRIAGGLMIIRAGFGLLTSKAHRGKKVSRGVLKEGLEKDDISFTPLAMPMLSGPGSIAVSIGMYTSTLSYSDISYILAAITMVAAVTFVILMFSHQLVSYLGKAGLSALSRIMGFIVLAIGVNFVSTGILSLLGK
ncbi:MarC family NAAT transporter [uncultured Pontibacter sp.]|uniref:MarC family NAAT transporter n=1 Tax=uncultured Pontibacter sp. TaxID=453356 RepID=UPI002629E7B3|nr:MarC family NAAT transporter [uncultured Pontibacter sp.]